MFPSLNPIQRFYWNALYDRVLRFFVAGIRPRFREDSPLASLPPRTGAMDPQLSKFLKVQSQQKEGKQNRKD